MLQQHQPMPDEYVKHEHSVRCYFDLVSCNLLSAK